MDESMKKRLNAICERVAVLDRELAQDDVASNLERFTKISKERADLEGPHSAYKEYMDAERTVADSIEMEQSGDPELVEFAKEERRAASAKMEQIEERLKMLLLPKDPNDDKNIIVEIRGAVGGDEANIFAGDLLRMYG